MTAENVVTLITIAEAALGILVISVVGKLAYNKPNPLLFILLGGVSQFTGYYWPGSNSSIQGGAIGALLVMLGFFFYILAIRYTWEPEVKAEVDDDD